MTFLKTAKYCPEPPTIEAGGTVFANNTGNKYGAACLGNDAEDPVPTTCPLVRVQHEKQQGIFILFFSTNGQNNFINSCCRPQSLQTVG